MSRIVSFFTQDFWTILYRTIINVPKEYYFLSGLVFVFIVSFESKKKESTSTVYQGLIYSYVTWLFSLTVLSRESVLYYRINLLPFSSWIDAVSNYYILYEIIYNILMFVPLGFLLYKNNKNLLYSLLCSGIFAGIIEIMQLLSKRGLCETDDLISALFGAAIGFFVGKIIESVFQN